jgi:hypothetical protein
LADVNEITDTICIPNHGITNGQQVNLSGCRLPIADSGINRRQIYTIFVVDENNVRLFQPFRSISHQPAVTVDSTHSFIPYKPVVFQLYLRNPLMEKKMLLTIIGHGFMDGSKNQILQPDGRTDRAVWLTVQSIM